MATKLASPPNIVDRGTVFEVGKKEVYREAKFFCRKRKPNDEHATII